MSLRVLHVLDHSIPTQTGYTFRTLSILREQRKLGWETFHLTTPKHGMTDRPEEEVDGWHFHRTPMSNSTLSRVPVGREMQLMRDTARRLGVLAREIRPDVIHAHSPVLSVLPALSVGRRLNIPVVYEIRAFWEDAAVDHGTAREGGLRYRLTRGLETLAVRRADHVTTICEGLRQDLVSRGIPHKKITVIPNAVDPQAFNAGGEPDAELRNRLGLNGTTVLGFIGSFYAYEGLDLLIDSLPLIAKRHPKTRLLLVGGGPQEDTLRRRVAERGLQDRVVFAGRVPNAQVPKYYDLIDLLVYARHSMRLTDLVTPLKPLEAMAQGRVFIASDVGGHLELVRDGVTGFLFRAGDMQSLADKAHRILVSGDLRESVRTAARRHVETERTWARSVIGYRPVFERLAGRTTA